MHCVSFSGAGSFGGGMLQDGTVPWMHLTFFGTGGTWREDGGTGRELLGRDATDGAETCVV